VTRLVVVNHFPVLPARGGGQLAVAGLTAALAATWPTELVWTERRGAAPHAVDLGGVRVTASAVPLRWLQRHAARWLRRWLGRVDTDIGTLLFAGGQRALAARLDAAVQDGDILLLAHPWLWPAVERVLAKRRVRFVYDAHNVEHRLKGELYPANPVSRRIVEHVRRTEAAVVQRADLVLACTEGDAALLAPGVRERVHVGSKGIAPSAAADAMAVVRQARGPVRVALFVGSEHGPNNAAARWIIETLAPAVPGWRFDIAGACGPAAGVAPGTPNVRVLGRVDDLGPLLAEAGVALNPMTGGSGINMKLFEYLQAGLPVVSTAFGARGFESLADTGIVQADLGGFAAALEALTTERARWQALAAAGPACVRAHFAWPVVAAGVRARIEALPAAGAGR
jgi:glycosyltransferase involved in cell wall biosynthesis